jgi:hypothetical protein
MQLGTVVPQHAVDRRRFDDPDPMDVLRGELQAADDAAQHAFIATSAPTPNIDPLNPFWYCRALVDLGSAIAHTQAAQGVQSIVTKRPFNLFAIVDPLDEARRSMMDAVQTHDLAKVAYAHDRIDSALFALSYTIERYAPPAG